MNFDQAFERLIGHEGGFTNRHDDPGNLTPGGEWKGTKYGISARAYPGEDIENLTLERAKAIYAKDYWGAAGCDAVPDAIKFDLFDMAVNSGVRAAIKTLQLAASETQDGILGPRTLLALQTMPQTRLVARFNGARLSFMAGLPNWPAAGRGWARRIAGNLMEA